MKPTGIKDVKGNMIHEHDYVKFPMDDHILKVVWVGDGGDMDWAADRLDGKPDAWLDSSCEIVEYEV